jgi:hypothetical protein
MNERIEALRYVITMAQEFSDEQVLGDLLETAASIGVKNDARPKWAQALQQACIRAGDGGRSRRG